MKKEIEESHFMTKKELKGFRLNNRGKIIRGSYNRMNSGKGREVKYT